MAAVLADTDSVGGTALPCNDRGVIISQSGMRGCKSELTSAGSIIILLLTRFGLRCHVIVGRQGIFNSQILWIILILVSIEVLLQKENIMISLSPFHAQQYRQNYNKPHNSAHYTLLLWLLLAIRVVVPHSMRRWVRHIQSGSFEQWGGGVKFDFIIRCRV